MTSLLHLANYVNGVPFTAEDFSSTGRPVIRIRQLVDSSAEPDLFDGPVPNKGRVEDGDLIFSWSGSLAVRIWDRGPAVLNQHLFNVRPTLGVDKGWLRWLLESKLTYFEGLMHGSAMTHLTADMLRSVRVEVPSLDEQRRIAKYLDAENARLHLLGECYRNVARVTAERELAYMRTLLSGRGDGSESAVPWLPTSPIHWRVVPLRYVSRIQRGASPRPIDDPKYFDEAGSHAWVRIADVSASRKHLTKTTQRLSALGKSLSVALEPGELFVSIAASVGKPMITMIPCCIHDGFVAIRNLVGLNAELLYYMLLLGDMFRGLGKLGTQLNLNSDTIGSIVVPMPPPGEQEELLDRLRENSDQNYSLQSLIERQLRLLAERRQALITAAVTGQIDVSTTRGVSA